ncbi:MAG: metallophosphoesterase family protein [Acidobacteria bacterium]|nr:metallophosphoesterase family protein [Acidobacteriota bacterium]
MRSLILSDIHGNLEALEAVLASARVDEGRYDAVWNLGDVVGYGGSPNEVTSIIRERATAHVRGNHDKVCCGNESGLGFNPIARQAAQWTNQSLTEENRAWLRHLPQGPVVIEPFSSVIVHGSPLHEDTYIVNMRDAWAPLQQMEQQMTFFGHTHIQCGFAWKNGAWTEFRPRYATSADAEQWTLDLAENTRYLLNPGSVGQPRDGDWRAAYAVLDSEANTVIYHRIPYDLARAQGRILMAELPERLAARLRDGR